MEGMYYEISKRGRFAYDAQGDSSPFYCTNT
jgi:hypothetical protein